MSKSTIVGIFCCVALTYLIVLLLSIAFTDSFDAKIELPEKCSYVLPLEVEKYHEW